MDEQEQQPRARRPGLAYGRVLLLSAGTTCTVVAWGLLVFAAINFGRQARDGASANWGFLATATVGAAACMFLAIVLASRLQGEMMRGSGRSSRPVRSTESSAGKRAAR